MDRRLLSCLAVLLVVGLGSCSTGTRPEVPGSRLPSTDQADTSASPSAESAAPSGQPESSEPATTEDGRPKLSLTVDGTEFDLESADYQCAVSSASVLFTAHDRTEDQYISASLKTAPPALGVINIATPDHLLMVDEGDAADVEVTGSGNTWTVSGTAESTGPSGGPTAFEVIATCAA